MIFMDKDTLIDYVYDKYMGKLLKMIASSSIAKGTQRWAKESRMQYNE